MSYLLAFLGFAALIILHEFGHFAAAKAVGMRVEKFSLFFGPLLVKKRIGETDYGIGPIPLGGYVRITGMNPNEEIPPEAVPRAYYNQPVWKRVVVILAGPAVNLLIAFVIIWALFLSNGQVIVGKQVAAVGKGTPAATALHPGDQVISVDGVSGSADAIRNEVDKHRCPGAQVKGCVAATPATVVVRRNGELLSFKLRPQYSASDNRMLLGFEFGNQTVPVGPGTAASLTVTGLWGVTKQTVSKVATLFEPQSRKSIHSVVGAYKVTQQDFGTSTTLALYVLALISLSLAVINLFPFLPLDGGHVFWAVAEKVRGKRIPFEVMERASAVGFVLILIVFAIGLSNDISSLTGSGINLSRRGPVPRLIGINHVALEVGDVDEALDWYGQFFEFGLRGRGARMAFIDMGDQFIALAASGSHADDAARHFGLVVDDKEATRAALRRAGVSVPERGPLDFHDPWGNQVQVVDYRDIQFTKAPAVLDGMGLQGLGKSDSAQRELREKGMAP